MASHATGKARVERNPRDFVSLAILGETHVLKARESGDLASYERAEEALQKSRDQLRALAARAQTVREEERTRVAREIHDELGQALTAIKIVLSSLMRDLPADKKQQFESILKLADETIQSVRRISTELRPAILDAVGLVAAVEWAADEFAARTGTKCRFDMPQDDIVIDRLGKSGYNPKTEPCAAQKQQPGKFHGRLSVGRPR